MGLSLGFLMPSSGPMMGGKEGKKRIRGNFLAIAFKLHAGIGGKGRGREKKEEVISGGGVCLLRRAAGKLGGGKEGGGGGGGKGYE